MAPTDDTAQTPAASELQSPVPGECWKTLRGWLDDLGVEFEPNLHAELGLTGYAVRLRNYLLGIGLGMRSTGPVLTITAVLCRGMDREHLALAAADRANGQLGIGQVLYFPGPPAELSFFGSWSFDLVDDAAFVLLFDAVLTELNNVGFPAVMAVRGYHPLDHAAPWGEEGEAAADEAEGEAAADDGIGVPGDPAPAPGPTIANPGDSVDRAPDGEQKPTGNRRARKPR
jgi:hypothetical protein